MVVARWRFCEAMSHNKQIRNLHFFAFPGSSLFSNSQQIDPAHRELAKEWAFAVNPSRDHGAGDLNDKLAVACHSLALFAFLTTSLNPCGNVRRDQRQQPLFDSNLTGSLNPGTGSFAHGGAPGCLGKGGCVADSQADPSAKPNSITCGQRGRPICVRRTGRQTAVGACVATNGGSLHCSHSNYRQDLSGAQAPT